MTVKLNCFNCQKVRKADVFFDRSNTATLNNIKVTCKVCGWKGRIE